MKRPLGAAILAAGILSAAGAPAWAETFRRSIIDKDKDSFLKLFLREDITWSAAFTDASIDRMHARVLAKDPSKARPPRHFSSTPRKFIEGIASDPAPQEETFSNVRIETDGEVAQVWFDYSFMDGSYRANWGKEAWHLVRTDAGWKIASVVWSMETNPEPPPPPKPKA